MAYTTSGAVQGVLMADYNGVNSLIPFIETASAMVERVVTCAVRKGYTLSMTEKELIERWLAAHFYVMSDQPYEEKQTLRARGKFQGYGKSYGMRLEASKYGQTALTLDPSGCLNALGQSLRARIKWAGKVPTEQIDYVDRD